MKGFKEYQELLKLDFKATVRHFNCQPKKINRISARVKFVLSFEAVKTKDYKENTMAGYNGLFKTFLTYSAFEGFLGLFPFKKYEVEANFTDYDYENISNEIFALDSKDKFMTSLSKDLNPGLKVLLEKFQNKEAYTPLIVAAGIRHIFAHGKLTPNINDANPIKVGKICDILSDLMLQIMDTEFEKKVMPLYKEIKNLT